MTLEALNQLPVDLARAALERCCGSRAWVERMLASRPFASPEALMTAAERAWRGLGEADWREAFSHHPRIGDVEGLRRRFASTAGWAAEEQLGASLAAEATLTALAEGNRKYEERFGCIFIVCATGKSASEMLGLIEQRLQNDPDEEIRIAAEEQLKITRLRLQKLLEEDA